MKTSIKLFIAAMLWMAVVANTHAQPTDNVVAYYPFCSNANDVTINVKNGTVAGATLTSDRLGKANCAYSFDGATGKINLPKALLPGNSAFAINIWIKPIGNHTTSDNIQFFADLRGQYQVALMYRQPNNPSPNSIQFYALSGSTTATVTSANNIIQLNQWNHIVATYGNNRMELYINGALIGSCASNPPNAITGYTYNTIGKDGDATLNKYWFYGFIDEVIVYKRGLTSTEVQALYNRGLTSSEIPELYYKPNLQYTYDAIGRRTSRNAIVLKSASYINTLDSAGLEQAFAPGETYEENMGNQKVIIYPNPTRGQLLVEIQGYEKETNTALYLFDLSGKLLISKKPANSSMPLDLTSYPLGTYVLKIMLGDKTSEWKIIKE